MTAQKLSLLQIQSLAQRFTELLKSKMEQDSNFSFAYALFPFGSCKRSSRLLAFILAEMSFPTTYVVASSTNNKNQEHAWLRFDNLSGSGIIDLTCCQFDYCNLPCPYVEETSEWHNKHWQIEKQEDVANLRTPNGTAELEIRNQMLSE